MVLFGIPNCNTVKKARTWLESKGLSYRFHDYKKEGLTATQLNGWLKQVSWQELLNTRGTTWRLLEEGERAKVTNAAAAKALMLEKNSIIKRPLVEVDGVIKAIGFDESEWTTIFKSK